MKEFLERHASLNFRSNMLLDVPLLNLIPDSTSLVAEGRNSHPRRRSFFLLTLDIQNREVDKVENFLIRLVDEDNFLNRVLDLVDNFLNRSTKCLMHWILTHSSCWGSVLDKVEIFLNRSAKCLMSSIFTI
jgi:hypothetical protein